MLKKPQSQGLLTVFILALTLNWLTFYLHFSDFGLVADDYSRLTEAMQLRLTADGVTRLQDAILYQGRPVHNGLILLFLWLGFHLGGLSGIYLIGLLVGAVNAVLLYMLVNQLTKAPYVSLFSTLFYLLFPAHTLQLWPTAIFGIQTAIAFLLLGLNCYLSKRRVLSYLLAFIVLLTYEPVYTIFLAAPLLKLKKIRLSKEIALHIAVTASLFLVSTTVKKFLLADNRLSNLDLLDLARHLVRNIVYGPPVSITSYFYRFISGIIPVSIAQAFLLLFAAVLFYLLLRQVCKEQYLKQAMQPHRHNKSVYRSLARIATTGLLLSYFSYPLSLSTNVLSVSGRTSRIHIAASIGTAIFLGAVAGFLIISSKKKRKKLVIVLMSVLFSGLVGFGWDVQKQYAANWEIQKSFWTDVISLTPDLEKGDLILIEGYEGVREPNFIDAFEFSKDAILNYGIYQVPYYSSYFQSGELKHRNSLKLHFLKPDWRNHILNNNNLIEVNINSTYGKGIEPNQVLEYKPQNVIFLEINSGKLVRVNQPISVSNKVLTLKTQDKGLDLNHQSFEVGYLYDALISK